VRARMPDSAAARAARSAAPIARLAGRPGPRLARQVAVPATTVVVHRAAHRDAASQRPDADVPWLTRR
jgi:hypothetical protein